MLLLLLLLFLFAEMFIKEPKFHETSLALKNVWLRACLIKKKIGRQWKEVIV